MKKRLNLRNRPAAKSLPLLALDSGAFSWHQKHFAARDASGQILRSGKAARSSKFTAAQSAEFREYLDRYISFLTQHQKHFAFCATFDVIYNPEATWDIYKEMTSAGLKVMPVYHFGEDVKWLKKYMASTDYIGLGGLGNMNKKQWLEFGLPTWKMICDEKGRPRVKVHGFAMGAIEMLLRFPYYSVDATSPFRVANYGAVMLPKKIGKRLDYCCSPFILPTSPRSHHVKDHYGLLVRNGDIEAASLECLEVTGQSIKTLDTDNVARCIVNFDWTAKMAKAIKEYHSKRLDYDYPFHYYISGSPASGTDGLQATYTATDCSYLGYLGTFHHSGKRYIQKLLDDWHGIQI